jgi:hypothetical protein
MLADLAELREREQAANVAFRHFGTSVFNMSLYNLHNNPDFVKLNMELGKRPHR